MRPLAAKPFLAAHDSPLEKTLGPSNSRDLSRFDASRTILQLALQFGLSSFLNVATPKGHFDHPRIEFIPPAEMAERRYGDLLSAGSPEAAKLKKLLSLPGRLLPLVAFYNKNTKTLYLPEGWRGRTADELSILVHELVHHLQTKAGLHYECSAAREEMTYEAQDKWLKMFGLTLEKEFGINRLTLIVISSCAFLNPP